MGMPAVQMDHREWTAELARALPEDGKRYEVIDGELLVTGSPSGRHQRAVAKLWRIVDDYVSAHQLGVALMSPSDIEYSPRRYVQPDLYVVPLDGTSVARNWNRLPQLMLVAEVLSPSTARHDRRTKRRMYLDEGVPQYWIVDPHARLIERWRPGDERPEVCDVTIEWHAAGHVPSLVIDLQPFFEDVHAVFPEDIGW